MTSPDTKPGRRGVAWEIIKIVLTLAVVVAVCAWLWADVFRPRLLAKNFGEVEPGLFRSGQIGRHVIGPTLRGHRIDVIVSMNTEPGDPDDAAEKAAARSMGIARVEYNLRGDGTGDPQMYVKGLTRLVEARRAGETVLVHCAAGSERTSGVIGLYRVLFEGWQPRDAAAEMFAFRHDPRRSPNLLPYLNAHVGEIAQGLVDAGLLDRVPDPLPIFPTGR